MIDPEFWTGRTVIVTGGTGFLGSQVVALLQPLATVHVASRRLGVDLSVWEECRRYFDEHPADFVINCAALQGGLRFNELVPGEIYLKNLLMGAYAMEAARLSEVRKYVNIVAGCSYPGYAEGDLTEGGYWEGPLHDSVVNYGITKKVQTVQGWSYKRQYNFDSVHLVMTNLYGPGDHFEPERSHALGALVRKFVDAVEDGATEVEVWGSGRPMREWLYVTDAAEAIIRAAERVNEVAPLNIGTGIGHSIRELAEKIASIVRFPGSIVYNADRPDGALRKVFDVRRMRQMLEWEPRTSLADGIQRTVEYYRQNVRPSLIAS